MKLAMILGARGTLGNAVRKAVPPGFEIIAIDREPSDEEHILGCDVRNRQAIRNFVQSLQIADFKHIVLICSVGIFASPTFERNFDEDALCDSLSVNLVGVAQFVCSMAQRALDLDTSLRVVVVTSAASDVGSVDVGYGTSKAGLCGLVKSLSKCLASRGDVVIGVSPGIFDSPMASSVSADRQNSAALSTHCKRKGTVEEIRNVVLFSAFEAPPYMTGSIIRVNGGQYS